MTCYIVIRHDPPKLENHPNKDDPQTGDLAMIVIRHDPPKLENHPNKDDPQTGDLAMIQGKPHIFWRGKWQQELGATYITDKRPKE